MTPPTPDDPTPNGLRSAIVRLPSVTDKGPLFEFVAAWEADRRRLETLEGALEQADVAMDGAAIYGVKSVLPRPYWSQWVEAHKAVRETLALAPRGRRNGE